MTLNYFLKIIQYSTVPPGGAFGVGGFDAKFVTSQMLLIYIDRFAVAKTLADYEKGCGVRFRDFLLKPQTKRMRRCILNFITT